MDLLTLTIPISDDLLGWFLETTLVASALATLAALAARVPRLAPSPAARHTLWLIILIKMVTPPLVHWPWSVPSLIANTHNASVMIPAETECVVITELATASADEISDPSDRETEPMTASVMLEDPQAEISQLESFPAFQVISQSPVACIAISWLVESIGLGLVQARSISRFRRLLFDATPAPSWLSEEAELIGKHLSVRVPSIQVVPRLGTPVLWCLGRPVLLVPDKLIQTLESDRWGAILAHELAHLRRGDHWVRRLELLAGLVWWWNPLYWLVRNRLDFEAELACDAWAVWASPRDRFSYAESLLQICTNLSSAGSPSPALGIIGTGRSFERRLTMILRSRVDRRVSAPSLLVGSLLAALALPSWTMADDPVVVKEVKGTVVVSPEPVEVLEPLQDVVVIAKPVADVLFVYVADDDDDDDKDKDKAAKDDKQKEKAAKLKAARIDMSKKLEAMSKEMEAKFGPNSEFVKEIEKEFGPGSDFAKKMEAFEKEMKAKFGPDSDFAKKMEAMGKSQEFKFGPDSDFAKKLKEQIVKDVAKAGEKGELREPKVRFEIRRDKEASEPVQAQARARVQAQANAERARGVAAKVRGEMEKARTESAKARVEDDKAKLEDDKGVGDVVRLKRNARVELRSRVVPDSDKRTKRIEALESLIEELSKELKQLKADSAPSKDEDEG